MDYVFLIGDLEAEDKLAPLAPGDSVTLLIAADPSHSEPGFERSLESLRRRASIFASRLSSRGIHSKVLIEWGAKADVAASCAQREKAQLL